MDGELVLSRPLKVENGTGNEREYWTGADSANPMWTTNKELGRVYKSRDDIMEVEKDNLEQLGYNWKYFIFRGFCSNYSGGIAWAKARDIDEAKAKIIEQYRKKHDKDPWEWGKVSTYPLDDSMAGFIEGDG